MLKLDLAELERAGRVELEGVLPPDDPVWAETGFRFTQPVSVRLVARPTTSGEVLVRGSIEAQLATECRRCTKPVTVELDEETGILFSPPDQREELVLAVPNWVVCDPGCRGLCPVCGVNWNEEECDCDTSEPDPRWEALRSLTEE
jgi:uncharacterized protein